MFVNSYSIAQAFHNTEFADLTTDSIYDLVDFVQQNTPGHVPTRIEDKYTFLNNVDWERFSESQFDILTLSIDNDDGILTITQAILPDRLRSI